MLTQAYKHHLDIVVSTDTDGEKLIMLNKEVLAVKGWVFSQKNFDAAPEWGRTGNIAVARIHNGQIVSRTNGTNIAEAFYQEQ